MDTKREEVKVLKKIEQHYIVGGERKVICSKRKRKMRLDDVIRFQLFVEKSSPTDEMRG